MTQHDAACAMSARWVQMGPCDGILAHIVPTWGHIGHMFTYMAIRGHIEPYEHICVPIASFGAVSRSLGSPRALVVRYTYCVVCEGRSYRHFVSPFQYDWKRPWVDGVTAIAQPMSCVWNPIGLPLCCVCEGRSYRHLCTPLTI